MTGMLVIGVALLVMAVVPALNPSAVRGTAVAAPVPGPPSVGDCVRYSGSEPWNPHDPTPDLTGSTLNPYPTLQIDRCAGSRYGEVVALIADPVKRVVTANADGSGSVFDPNLNTCRSAALPYMGLPAADHAGSLQILTYWYPTPVLGLGMAASTPSLRQISAGQHWLACIGFPQGDIASAWTDPPSRYDTPLRGAILTGADRDDLGSCVIDVDPVQSQPTSCTDLHRGEIFGDGFTGNQSVSRAELERTCQGLIAELTRLPDITAGGALAVQLMVTGSDHQPVTAALEPAASEAVCGLETTGHRQLSASLLARGRTAIPWA